MTDYNTIQAEQKEWSVNNFGEMKHSYRPLLGIIEELGELNTAIEACRRDEALDAVGDIFIYMCDFCNHKGWDVNAVVANGSDLRVSIDEVDEGSSIASLPLNLGYVLGGLAHHQLKDEQGIRSEENHEDSIKKLLGVTVFHMVGICRLLGVDLLDVVSSVWSKVKHRNWAKNPDTAHEVAENEQR